MSQVIQLVRRLEQEPLGAFLADGALPAGVRLRNFDPAVDIAPWLRLRQRAFAREKLGIRDWSPEDFRREFLDKPWWDPGHFWLAEATTTDGSQRTLAGSITLARRGDAADGRPVVHWLMVDPIFRRRGLGRLLLAALEQRAWQLGHRAVWLETHLAWTAAAHFYEQHGYRVAAEPETPATTS